MRKVISIAILAGSALIMSGCAGNGTTVKDEKDSKLEAAKYYTKVGVIHMERGQLVEAKDPLTKALNASPGYADAHAAFGILYQLEKEYEEANKHYEKAVSNAPDDARIRNNYGSFLYSQSNYDEACDQFERASKNMLYPKRASAFVNLGRCLNQIGQADKALEMFEKAIILDNRITESYYELAKSHYHNSNLEKATLMIDRFREKNGRHTPQSLLLGVKIATEIGDKSKAKGYEITLKNMYSNTKENQEVLEYLNSKKQ